MSSDSNSTVSKKALNLESTTTVDSLNKTTLDNINFNLQQFVGEYGPIAKQEESKLDKNPIIEELKKATLDLENVTSKPQLVSIDWDKICDLMTTTLDEYYQEWERLKIELRETQERLAIWQEAPCEVDSYRIVERTKGAQLWTTKQYEDLQLRKQDLECGAKVIKDTISKF